MNLKILCAANTSNFHCVRYIDLLTKAGAEVHLVDDRNVGIDHGSTLAASHTRWPRSGRRTLKSLIGQAQADAIADWLTSVQLRSLWRRRKAHVCHVHWVDDRILKAAKAGLRPLVVTAYGSDINWTRLPSYDPTQLVQVKQGLAQVDLFIADSEDMIQIAEELAGGKLPSLLLPIGVNTNLFRPGYTEEAKAWRAELAIPAHACVILSPRVMNPNYRQIELAQAFAHAVRDHGLDGYMVFKTYAGDPAYVESLRKATIGLNVMDRIKIIGGVPYERLPTLYAMSDLAVSFPILDAFPVTFLEAGACEIPILTHHRIAYQSNGITEFLNFMEGEDVNSIGALMARLCRDPTSKERARAARQHIVRNFDETAFVCALLGAYGDVLNGRRQQSV